LGRKRAALKAKGTSPIQSGTCFNSARFFAALKAFLDGERGELEFLVSKMLNPNAAHAASYP
jgi:hypothetical protein